VSWSVSNARVKQQECQIPLSLYVMREEQLLLWQWLPSTN